MQHLIEQLSHEQLIDIIELLENDQKANAIQYIAKHTPLNELHALKVIEAIVNEHDAVLKLQTEGPRFSDDVTTDTEIGSTFTEEVAATIPIEPTLVAPPTSTQTAPTDTTPLLSELERKTDLESSPNTQTFIWMGVGILAVVVILIWIFR